MPPPNLRARRAFGNLFYRPAYISPDRKTRLLTELGRLHPIWEQRYSKNNPPPSGQGPRQLLRPVYWLGNWQFACLNYYHPPKGVEFRCVRAEAFPEELQNLVSEIEDFVHHQFDPRDIPREWKLNTCLINYYGSHLVGDEKIDVARVGEHKDFEPGPVASVSFGERALFQFVSSPHKGAVSRVVLQQWLEDSSLQIFGGEKFKKQLFHRVQRVERKRQETFSLNTPDFETRRLNLTFRFVPSAHVQDLSRFPAPQREDVLPYVRELSRHSDFFKNLLTINSKAGEQI